MAYAFSNSSEADAWVQENCERCWRGRNYVQTATFADSNPYCKPCESIMEGYITGEVSEKAAEYVKHFVCPNFQEHRPPRKKKQLKQPKEQLQLQLI